MIFLMSANIPIDVAEAAAEALGNFVSDHGWSDSDMQAMDNLDAYIARHKAIRAELAKPTLAPAWHDAPTEPGDWYSAKYDRRYHFNADKDIGDRSAYSGRWYGPIPQDKEGEKS